MLKTMTIVFIALLMILGLGILMRNAHTWDKVFPRNNNVAVQKVSFYNRYGIRLTGDLYIPKNANGRMPAIAVAGPFGAVKEQVSGRYAQEMASRGFITLAFDPSFTGQSGGRPRHVASPDINTEDFSAAVDYLITRNDVNADKIGIIGICGFGGFGLNAAAMDTRIKATATITMYDMTRVSANGYFDAMDADARYAMLESLNAQRSADAKSGRIARTASFPDVLSGDEPQYFKDYFDFYKTPRGYHKRSVASNSGWNTTSSLSLINMPILTRASEIRNPVLMVHGENAHSRYFSEDAFKTLTGNNKELYIVPNANHVDLYDQTDKIPFDKITQFFESYLN